MEEKTFSSIHCAYYVEVFSLSFLIVPYFLRILACKESTSSSSFLRNVMNEMGS